jgi:hypothetical protein
MSNPHLIIIGGLGTKIAYTMADCICSKNFSDTLNFFTITINQVSLGAYKRGAIVPTYINVTGDVCIM